MHFLLHRIDPEKNERRFYLVYAGPGLLDPHAVYRFWGRIGGQQRQLLTQCDSPEQAQNLAERLVRRKLKRGYKLVGDPPAGENTISEKGDLT